MVILNYPFPFPPPFPLPSLLHQFHDPSFSLEWGNTRLHTALGTSPLVLYLCIPQVLIMLDVSALGISKLDGDFKELLVDIFDNQRTKATY